MQHANQTHKRVRGMRARRGKKEPCGPPDESFYRGACGNACCIQLLKRAHVLAADRLRVRRANELGRIEVASKALLERAKNFVESHLQQLICADKLTEAISIKSEINLGKN